MTKTRPNTNGVNTWWHKASFRTSSSRDSEGMPYGFGRTSALPGSGACRNLRDSILEHVQARTGSQGYPKDKIAIPNALLEANALLAAGQAERALDLLRRTDRRSQGDRSVLQALSKIYVRLGRLKEAESALRRFRSIKPRADTSLLLAQILILDGRHAEAVDEAESLEPKHGGIAIARGDLLLRQGQRAAARKAYEHAREIDPHRAGGAAAARIEALDSDGQ